MKITLGDLVIWRWDKDDKWKKGIITALSRSWWVAKGMCEINRINIISLTNVFRIERKFISYDAIRILRRH